MPLTFIVKASPDMRFFVLNLKMFLVILCFFSDEKLAVILIIDPIYNVSLLAFNICFLSLVF